MQREIIGLTTPPVVGYGQVLITLSKGMIRSLTSTHSVLGVGSISTQQTASMITKQTAAHIWTSPITTC